jgi:predicted PurR-regulated permease PerM
MATHTRNARVPRKKRPLSNPEFARRVATAVGITIALLCLALVAWYAVQVLMLAFAGALLAVLLRGLSDLVARRTHLPNGWSLAVVVVTLLGLTALAGWLLLPSIVSQAAELFKRLPEAWAQLREMLGKSELGRVALDMVPRQMSDFPGDGYDVLGRVTGLASMTLSAVVSIVLVIAVAIYFAADPRLYVTGVVHLVPKRHRAHTRDVIGTIGTTLRAWLVGQALDMLVIGLLTGIGLWMLGVPLWFTLGLIAALTNFIPNFGPVIAFVPAAMVALSSGGMEKVLQVAVMSTVVQTIEGYFLLPLIQSRSVALPPAITILAQVLLGLLLGAIGVVLAGPLVAVMMVLVKILYVRDVLKDPVKVEGEKKEPVVVESS